MSHTADVTDLLRRWYKEILEHPPCSPDMSPCDYDLLVKVKEPLRGTRYNIRDEFIRGIQRSIRNINKDGCADRIRLPNVSKRWLIMGENVVEDKYGTTVNKSMSEISNCCHYFLSDPCNIRCDKIQTEDMFGFSSCRGFRNLISEHNEFVPRTYSVAKTNQMRCQKASVYTHTHTHIYIYIYSLGVRGDRDFWISGLIRNPDGTDI